MQQAAKVTVVNIISTAYSGSTWLNLMLGSHSKALSIGEIKAILRFDKAVCTLHGEDCPLWSQFEWPTEGNPYLQLHELTGKRLLLVNNSRKFMKYQDHPEVDARYLHLMRDGRVVTASMLRKFPDVSYAKHVRSWAHDVRRNERLLRRQPRDHRMDLIYEELKADPQPQLDRVCQWLGIQPEPGMEEYWREEKHFLGGNRGTLLSMMKQADPDAKLPERPKPVGEENAGPNWDLKFYEKSDPRQFRDERWKRELSDWQLRFFGLWAGRINRRYGYPPTLQRD